MTTLLLRARFWLLAVVVLGLIVLLVLNRHVEYNQSLTSFFPNDDPDVLAYQRASATFGNDNVVFLTYDDPELLTAAGMSRVAGLAEAVGPNHIEAVEEVQSMDRMPLFWEIDDRLADLARQASFLREPALRLLKSGMSALNKSDSPFTVGGALRSASGDKLKKLRSEITEHPLLRNTLVDARGTSTAVVVRLRPMADQEPKATIAALREQADRFAAENGLKRPFLVGPPVLLADGFAAIERDGQRLAIVGLGLIALVTLSVTHSLWWAIVPVLCGWFVWRAAEAILSVLGVRLALSGGPLVAQIIVLTMPAASHLAIHFRDALRTTPDRWHAARETLSTVASPVIWTALTGAVGYAALVSSRVVPVFQFGAVLACCTLSASLLTMAVAPVAMLPLIPLELPVRVGTRSWLASALNRLTRLVAAHPGVVVLSVLAVALPLSLGLFRLEYESNYIKAFKPDTRVATDYRETEDRIGGIGVVSLIVPADSSLSLENLNIYRSLADSIVGLRRPGQASAVAQVLSIATVLDPQHKLAALPPDQGAFALRAKLDLIAAAPQGVLLRSFWSPSVEGDSKSGWTRLVVRVSERASTADKEWTFRNALEQARAQPSLNHPQRPSYLTGLSYLLTQTTRGVMDTSWVTFAWSAAGIMIMLTWAFRGPRLALLALLPSMLAVGLVLGLTGWWGVKLDLATALVASVALGLSVDDTFHCLLQFRRCRRTQSFQESLLASYHVTGPGVVLSSLAVALGFAVLRFSEFVPFLNFGTMVGVATLGSSIGNLILLPACLALGHRWSERFRSRRAHSPAVAAAEPSTPVAAKHIEEPAE